MKNIDWLLERKKGIGASDAASVMGLSRWGSPISVYMDKITDEVKEIDSEPIEWGHRLEDVVARAFAEKTGKALEPKRPEIPELIMKHLEHDFIRANPDYFLLEEDSFLEVKTCSAYKEYEWENNEIPIEYLIQLNHTMAVTGHEYCYIAVLIGGQKFIWKRVDRDEEIIQKILETEIEFWNENVLKKVPPAPMANDCDVLGELFSPTVEDIRELGEDADELVEHYETIKNMIRNMQDQEKELKAKLLFEIKESEKAETERYTLTWRPQTAKRINTKKLKLEAPEIYEKYAQETVSRVLRFKKKAVDD